MVRLEQVLDSWRAMRADTAAAVEEFPAAEFDYKPSADIMTFGEIARHILVAGHGLTGLLLEGEEQLGGPQFREKMARFALLPADANPADLARELRASVEQRTLELAAASRVLFRYHHPRGRRAGHAPGNVAVCERARAYAQSAAIPVHADEGDGARHHPPPAGETGCSLRRQRLYNTIASVGDFRWM